MVRRHAEKLPALLVQPRRRLGRARVLVVADAHLDGGADTRKTKEHHANERPVPKTEHRVGLDGGEEGPRLLGLEHRRLALALFVAAPAHGVGGVHQRMWPVTSQSNQCLIAAKCCFTEAGLSSRPSSSM